MSFPRTATFLIATTLLTALGCHGASSGPPYKRRDVTGGSFTGKVVAGEGANVIVGDLAGTEAEGQLEEGGFTQNTAKTVLRFRLPGAQDAKQRTLTVQFAGYPAAGKTVDFAKAEDGATLVLLTESLNIEQTPMPTDAQGNPNAKAFRNWERVWSDKSGTLAVTAVEASSFTFELKDVVAAADAEWTAAKGTVTISGTGKATWGPESTR